MKEKRRERETEWENIESRMECTPYWNGFLVKGGVNILPDHLSIYCIHTFYVIKCLHKQIPKHTPLKTKPNLKEINIKIRSKKCIFHRSTTNVTTANKCNNERYLIYKKTYLPSIRNCLLRWPNIITLLLNYFLY